LYWVTGFFLFPPADKIELDEIFPIDSTLAPTADGPRPSCFSPFFALGRARAITVFFFQDTGNFSLPRFRAESTPPRPPAFFTHALAVLPFSPLFGRIGHDGPVLVLSSVNRSEEVQSPFLSSFRGRFFLFLSLGK